MADIVNLESHYIGSPTPGVNLYQLPNASMQVLGDLINATWNKGIEAQAAYSTKIDEIFSTFLDITAAPHVTTGNVGVPSIPPILVDIPTSIDASNVFDDFKTQYLELAAWLETKFGSFRTTHYPNEQTLYNAGEASLQAALSSGAYIPATVQQQIWGDDQARIVKDKNRAIDSVASRYASAGFPLPPDVAASAILQVEQKAQDELAESSRKIAIMSVEQYNKVIGNVLALRDASMKEAVDYIKGLASGPEISSRLVNVGYDIQPKLISAASAYYNADANAKDIIAKVGQYNNTVALEAATKNQASDLKLIESKLSAMLAEADTIGKELISLFNNLNVSASLAANGGTTVSQSGEL